MHRDFAVAVKAVIVRGDEVLVLRRSKGEMAGSYMNKYQKWDLPGGGLHFYEKAEDGLLREIREETSLSVEIGRPVSMFDIIRNQIPFDQCTAEFIFCLRSSWETNLDFFKTNIN